MERKYYLRGLGVGIVVTAVIMGMIASRNKTMTDQEIIARAKELGMVENTVLSDMDEEEQEQEQELERADLLEDVTETISRQDAGREPAEEASARENDPEPAEEETQPDVSADDGQVEEAVSGDIEPADDSVSEDEDKDPEEDIEETGTEEGRVQGDNAEEEEDGTKNAAGKAASPAVKTITINSGDGSHTVARKLADAGIVTSADTFDEFLCQNGYDKKLRTGTFSIPVDASDEQIARIVTGAE